MKYYVKSDLEFLLKGAFKELAIAEDEKHAARKKGPGSRGGKVIGRTKSGKPVYGKFNHPAHKNFSDDDHVDAHHAHIDAFKPSNNFDKNYERLKFHAEQGKLHSDAIGSKKSFNLKGPGYEMYDLIKGGKGSGVKGHVTWFNKRKGYGEGETHDGRKVFLPGHAFSSHPSEGDKIKIHKLKEDKEYGLYAHSAEKLNQKGENSAKKSDEMYDLIKGGVGSGPHKKNINTVIANINRGKWSHDGKLQIKDPQDQEDHFNSKWDSAKNAFPKELHEEIKNHIRSKIK